MIKPVLIGQRTAIVFMVKVHGNIKPFCVQWGNRTALSVTSGHPTTSPPSSSFSTFHLPIYLFKYNQTGVHNRTRSLLPPSNGACRYQLNDSLSRGMTN